MSTIDKIIPVSTALNLASVCKRESRKKSKQIATNCLFVFVCLFVTKRINKQDNLASVCKRESRQKSKQAATNRCLSSLFVCMFVCLFVYLQTKK